MTTSWRCWWIWSMSVSFSIDQAVIWLLFFFVTYSYTRTLKRKLTDIKCTSISRFSRNSLIPGLCWLPWKRGPSITSSTLTTTPWWRCGSLWSIEKTSSRRNVTRCTSSRKYLKKDFLVYLLLQHLFFVQLNKPITVFFLIRGNRFHSSWGGASYMGGVCSLTKGGGVNEVSPPKTLSIR